MSYLLALLQRSLSLKRYRILGFNKDIVWVIQFVKDIVQVIQFVRDIVQVIQFIKDIVQVMQSSGTLSRSYKV